jgi:hypothetical protein
MLVSFLPESKQVLYLYVSQISFLSQMSHCYNCLNYITRNVPQLLPNGCDGK